MNLVPYQVVLWEINTPPIPAKSPQNKTEKCISYLDTTVVKWKLPYCTTISCRTAKKQMWVNRALSSCLCWWPASLLPKPECYKFVSSGEIIQHLICSHRNPPIPHPTSSSISVPSPDTTCGVKEWLVSLPWCESASQAHMNQVHDRAAGRKADVTARSFSIRLPFQRGQGERSPATPTWHLLHLAPPPTGPLRREHDVPREGGGERTSERTGKSERKEERERETILYNNLSLSATPASLLTESKHEEEAELSMHGDSHD